MLWVRQHTIKLVITQLIQEKDGRRGERMMSAGREREGEEVNRCYAWTVSLLTCVCVFCRAKIWV